MKKNASDFLFSECKCDDRGTQAGKIGYYCTLQATPCTLLTGDVYEAQGGHARLMCNSEQIQCPAPEVAKGNA